MSKDKVKELENLGIGLYLSEDGAELLSKILGEGCPVKMVCNSPVQITCPLTWQGTNIKYYSCKTCWKAWLKSFIIRG